MEPTGREPIYFGSAQEWRAWLEAHHETEPEVLVGFHKKATGRQAMTWAQAVDEALCSAGSTAWCAAWTKSASASGSRRAGRAATGAR